MRRTTGIVGRGLLLASLLSCSARGEASTAGSFGRFDQFGGDGFSDNCWRAASGRSLRPPSTPRESPTHGARLRPATAVRLTTLRSSTSRIRRSASVKYHYPVAGEVAQVVSTDGQALVRVCDSDALLREYLTGRNDHGYVNAYVHTAPFLPSRQQWAGGARWMECDVFYGVRFPEIAPGRLAGALTGAHSAAYRLCMSGLPSSYVFTPCSKPHLAEAAGDVVEAGQGTPYPKSRAERLPLAQQCSGSVLSDTGGRIPAGYTTDFYPVRREAWPESLVGACVLVRLDGSGTTTSVHP